MQVWIPVVLGVLGIAAFLLPRSASSRRDKTRDSGKIIVLDEHRKARAARGMDGTQSCSACKKRNGKLVFYAQENGSVVGLCKDCRAQADKRDLMPL